MDEHNTSWKSKNETNDTLTDDVQEQIGQAHGCSRYQAGSTAYRTLAVIIVIPAAVRAIPPHPPPPATTSHPDAERSHRTRTIPPRRVQSRRRGRAWQHVRSSPHPPLVPCPLGVFRCVDQLLALGSEILQLVRDLHEVAVHLRLFFRCYVVSSCFCSFVVFDIRRIVVFIDDCSTDERW